MKKFLALLLALIMVMSLAACGGDEPTPTTEPTAAPTTAPTTGNDEPTTEPTEPAVEATYTYNTSITTFPSTWNPHTYQTATDSDMLGYLSDGFYGFDYNEDMTGYELVPYMTTDEHPVDVTADYVGQFGIEEGDSAQVYIINLRQDMCWQDGTPITAHSFVESAKRLLNPAAQNYRADTMYSGSVKIYNAENYLKQGQSLKMENYISDCYTVEDLVLGDDGIYYTPNGDMVYVAVNNEADGGISDWLGGYTLQFYVEYYMNEDGTNGYFDVTNWEDLKAAADENGYAPLTADTLAWLTTLITGNPAWGETAENVPCYLFYDKTFAEVAWEEVGIFAKSDYELVYVLTQPLSGFYLKYGLPSGYLVHTELYDACESIVDGVYTNTYGTSVDTSMSYGPYIMTTYQIDKEISFERNELYFDLTEDTYQTTNIVISYVPEASTRLELFLSGDLDVYGLQSDDMDTYALSDYTYYATGDSTFAMCFNPDLEALQTTQANAGENYNKTIITIPEFRMAMSFAMNRDDFCLATSPTNSAAFGLFSSTIISNPDMGIAYRNTDVAKETLAEFWGVSEDFGEGKLYADIDEAIASITGYNLTMAKQYFDAAYDKAIADGLMDEDDVIQICIGTPNATSNFYNNGYEFLVNNYTEAVKGTKLEGKIEFTRDSTLGNSFRDALNNNQVDMLFGVGWTGSALDPYGLIEAYVKPSYQYDGSFDYTAIDLTIEINGVEMTTDVYSWYEIMNGVACTVSTPDGEVEYSCGTADEDPEARLTILGKLEGAVLLNYNFIPIMDDASAQLKGQKIEYYNEEYIYGVGFGGIRYMTYNYTDAEWADYVASQNGELDYT